jgi:uncharacterized protein (TIGR00297 family)
MQILIGFIFGALIGIIAWRAQALSPSGAAAATLTGGLIFGLGGIPWAVLLLTFFISSSAISRLFATRKADLSEKFSKGSQRDWGQVMANGGLGATLAIVLGLYPGALWTYVAFTGAMAAVNADTWATELGVFSPTRPKLITSGQPVERGASGGITLWGYVAALAGALLLGSFATIFNQNANPMITLTVAGLAGLAGSTVDSFLGATIQSIYYCPNCKKETERHPLHSCGTETRQIRGWSWLNNDWVNFAGSLTGALTAMVLWLVLTQQIR